MEFFAPSLSLLDPFLSIVEPCTSIFAVQQIDYHDGKVEIVQEEEAHIQGGEN